MDSPTIIATRAAIAAARTARNARDAYKEAQHSKVADKIETANALRDTAQATLEAAETALAENDVRVDGDTLHEIEEARTIMRGLQTLVFEVEE